MLLLAAPCIKNIFLLKKFRLQRNVRAENLQSALEDEVFSSDQQEKMEFLVLRSQCQLLSLENGYCHPQEPPLALPEQESGLKPQARFQAQQGQGSVQELLCSWFLLKMETFSYTD